MSGVAPTVGARTSSAARTAASPIPWIWVAIPQRRGPRRLRRARPSGGGQPDAAAAVRRRRLAGAASMRLEQGRGARPERAVGERLEPAQPEPVERIRPERRRRCGARARSRRPAAPRRMHGVHAERQLAGSRRGRGTPRSAPPRSVAARRRPGRGRRRRPSASELAAIGARSAAPSRRRPGGGMMRRLTSRAADSWRTPVAAPSASRRITPPAGSGVRSPTPASRQGRVARDERVMVVRPQRDPPTGRRPPRGRRPSASGPARRGPSRRPGSIASPVARSARAPDPWPRASIECAALELDLRPRERRLGEVQVRVGQARGWRPRRRRARSGGCPGPPALDVDRGAGGDHPPGADRRSPRPTPVRADPRGSRSGPTSTRSAARAVSPASSEFAAAASSAGGDGRGRLRAATAAAALVARVADGSPATAIAIGRPASGPRAVDVRLAVAAGSARGARIESTIPRA